MYSYNYLFLQIFIISFCISINQLKKCASFWHNSGVIRVNDWSLSFCCVILFFYKYLLLTANISMFMVKIQKGTTNFCSSH